MTTTQQPPTRIATARPLTRWRRPLTVLAAVAAAALTWAISVPLVGVDLDVTLGGAPRQVGLPAVVVASLLAGLAGWLVLALLEKVTTRAALAWRLLASLVLLVSLLGPLTSGSGPVTVVLVGLHVLVGGILIWGLPRPAAHRHRARDQDA